MIEPTAKYLSIAFAIWFTQCQFIKSNPTVNIECDCSSTSFESDPSACCINELPEFSPSSPPHIIYTLPNASLTHSSITQFKLHSVKNLSEIPAQIIDTFRNLAYVEASIGLRSIPSQQLPTKLKQLNFGYNHIATIEANAFRNGGERLEYINLQYNDIESIGDGAFSGLNKLTALTLYHNKFSTLKRTTVSGAVNLQDIDLSSNEIATIEDGAFDLPHLKELLISENELKVLADNIFAGAPNLQNVDLQKNQLEHIGKAFEATRHLHQLQLSGNHYLDDLNVLALSTLPELISLSVDASGIRSLTTSAVTVTSRQSPLHTLSMSQNHLSSADFLRQLSIFGKIEKLFVDANKFRRWNDADVRNIKQYFPHIEFIVIKSNVWDRRWVADVPSQ